uniref:Major sperm protein n=1 Tax=Plectus sambesii TaxID=2011161 RepID=A0A914WVV2_9BILA
MSKPSQILQIDPPTELTFRGPFTDVVTSYLKLTNPSDKQVCFKVKTTAPKQYCVRPNSGLIPPGGNVSVAVMLQPIDLATDQERNKHKFMVQSAFVPDGETSLENIWKSTSTTDLMDSKLRVVFDSPDSHGDHLNLNLTGDKPLAKTGASPAKSSVLESDYRRELDEKKRLQNNLGNLEKENNELRQRVKRLEVSGGGGGSDLATAVSEGGLPLLHVALVVLAALLVGLILGKLF